jgi:hypothetical protein
MIRIILAFMTIAGFARAEEPPKRFSYLTSTVTADGIASLQTALKTLKPRSGKGPTIYLVSVAHIGEASYYAAIQKHLNLYDLVLYEGVGTPPFRTEIAKESKDPVAWTRSALIYLRDMAVWYRKEMGSLPDDIRKLRLAVKLHQPKDLAWVDRVRTNAWGKPIVLGLENGVCSLQSLGRDGKIGGIGPDADLTVKLSVTTRRSDAGGLQRRLANSLNLEFQIDLIDYSKPTFVNSDMGMVKLQEVISGKVTPTAPPDSIQSTVIPDPAKTKPTPSKPNNEFKKLLTVMQGGNPAIEWLSSLGEGILSRSEEGREMVKWVLCEILTAAEVMMENLAKSKSKELAGTAKMMRVLIRDRNAIVITDLKRYMKEKPRLASVAIFYGAGHMRDIEARLEKELNYAAHGTEWLTAFQADRKKAGITPEQARSIRETISKQLKALK